jgi:hypothetical protein
MGIGMQIDIYAEWMTDGQMALFCVAGAVATLFAGIMLAALAGKNEPHKKQASSGSYVLHHHCPFAA